MQLVQLAALFVMLMYLLSTETSGARTCWFHKRTRRGLRACVEAACGGTIFEGELNPSRV